MDQLRSTKFVTRILLCFTVFKVSLAVSRGGTNSQEDNYTKVSCDFENNLCGWRNLNPGATWTKKDGCGERNFWGKCKTTLHYRRLEMNNLAVNTTGTLVGPSLFARTDVRCHLSFLYHYDCENDACQLSVERQTHTGVEQLWNVTTYSGTVNTANVDVRCSDTEYQILIVGKKLKNGRLCCLDVDNIVFNHSTLPKTTEGSAISSLSRRVSPTTFTSLEATSTPSLTSNEPMLNPDKQTSDDDGLGTGPVVAIVIVIVFVVVIVVVIVVIVIRRRNGAEKHNRASGAAGSTTPGNSNLGGVEGHDNLAYSANRLEMDTIPPMSGNAANPENTPDYYNVSRINSPGTGPSAPAQEDVYENTRTPPTEDEYAVVNKNGKKKQDTQPEDEYALPNKDQQKKKKREKQAGQGQQKNDIPTENKKKKGRKTDHQANPSALNSNAAGRSTQAEEAAAAGTSDYEPVGANSGMATSRPEQSSDMYNKLRDKGRAGMQLETPQTHYDHISAPDGDYSGMDLEDTIRDQQREAVAEQYSHI